jgi:hypothetical protein
VRIRGLETKGDNYWSGTKTFNITTKPAGKVYIYIKLINTQYSWKGKTIVHCISIKTDHVYVR